MITHNLIHIVQVKTYYYRKIQNFKTFKWYKSNVHCSVLSKLSSATNFEIQMGLNKIKQN